MSDPTPNYTPDPAFVEMLEASARFGVAQLTSIVARLDTIQGTAAEHKLQAIAALKAKEKTTIEGGTDGFTGLTVTDTSLPFSYLDWCNDQIELLTAQRDEAKNAADNAVRVYLTAKHADNTTERDGLVTQYKELSGMLEGMARFGVTIPAIPPIPKGTGGGTSTSSTSRVSSKTGEHYYIKATSAE